MKRGDSDAFDAATPEQLSQIAVDPSTSYYLGKEIEPEMEVPTRGRGIRHFYDPNDKFGLLVDEQGASLSYDTKPPVEKTEWDEYSPRGAKLTVHNVEVPRHVQRQGRASALYNEMFDVHGYGRTFTSMRLPDGVQFRKAYRYHPMLKGYIPGQQQFKLEEP